MESNKRGQRDSPRTPSGDTSKLDKLKAISQKLSPASKVPNLPGTAVGTAGDETGGSADKKDEVKVLDAIESLSQKLDKMALKSDLDTLQAQIEQSTKVAVASAVDPLKNEMADMKTETRKLIERADANEVRIGKLEEFFKSPTAKDMVGIPPSVQAKIQSLEAAVTKLLREKNGGASNPEEMRCQTAVFGGLATTVGFDEAEAWLKSKLKDFGLPEPTKVYCKGEFVGMVFATFASEAVRDEVVNKWKKTQPKHNSSTAWAKQDLAPQQRAERSFLFGLKWQLIQWKFPKAAVWVDLDSKTLFCGGETVVSVNGFIENSLDLEFGTDWNDWPDFRESAELKGLVDNANGRAGKGVKGKGKSKKKTE